MAPSKIIIPPRPKGAKAEIILGSPATESGASAGNRSDDDMASDSGYEDDDDQMVSDSEYEDADEDDDLEDEDFGEADEVDLIAHHDNFADHEIYHSSSSSIDDFPLDYDSAYDIGDSSPRKRQRMSPEYIDHTIAEPEIEQPQRVRIPDMFFKINYDDDDVFEIPPLKLRKSSDADEGKLFFSELELPVRSKNVEYIDLPANDGDVSDLDLDVEDFGDLPDTVTIRKPRKASHKYRHRNGSVSDHVPLGEGFDLTPSNCTPAKRRNDTLEDAETSPTKRRSHAAQIETPASYTPSKRRSDTIEEIETPAPKRGRTINRPRQLATPPNSSHTSPARRVQAPNGSPITAMRMGITSAHPAPVASQKQTDWRIIDSGDGLIMCSSRTDSLILTSPPSPSVPDTILRSGRTPDEEMNYLVANSGFIAGQDSLGRTFRERIKAAYPQRKLAWMRTGWNGPKPHWLRGGRLGNGEKFTVFEDSTATPAKKPTYISYRNSR